MWVSKECTNPDCKEFGIQLVHHTSLQVHPEYMYCTSCLIGKMVVHMSHHRLDAEDTLVEEKDEEVSAMFHLNRIFKK
ncbi:hypothetical protein [Ammoniphilus sp. CFH 90114]|uniref:hypothetical protein n=1 Tax=Ammoniphilus sp. CFH 90114 TaxID=2493665 RepID=UPI0010255DA6|nr:hypothetical protein [Ammoniphilus sp. CFH 90114]RXT15240.1 hypothetical protein EIZ39_03245 [Ammoniphilus sp. CFH 90114]